MKQQLLDQGYLIIENFFEPSRYPIMATVGECFGRGVQSLRGIGNTRHIQLLNSGHPLFTSLILETGVLDIAKSILGASIRLCDYQTVTLHPGAPALNAHIDYPYLLLDKLFIEPILQLQTLWVLDDLTVENGATRIVPYSHFECDFPDTDLFEARSQPLLLSKGSLVVFHGALWHGSDANRSAEDRSTLLMSFCPPWIKPLMDVSKIERTGLPRDLRELPGDFHPRLIRERLKAKQYEEYNVIKK